MGPAPILLDHLADLLAKGYTFSADLLARSTDPRKESRLKVRAMGDDALFVRGEEGVKLFYDNARIQRTGAMPSFVGGGLFGRGSLHGLDGERHLGRKAMFIRAVMLPERVEALLDLADVEWARTIDRRWLSGGSASVYDVSVDVYGRALLRWAGIETDLATATRIAREEAAIVDGFAVIGPAWIRTQIMRRRCDAWFVERIREARAGRYTPPEGTSFALVLAHREPDGQPMDDHTAAVELQNAIRPGIAVCRFAAFLSLAFHEHPEWRERVAAEVRETGSTRGGPVAMAVAHEVRRFYPFVPLLPAVAREDLTFEGEELEAGKRVLIDIYGTNHDERHWEDPDTFNPQRFLGTGEADAPYLIPQGGGDAHTGHRCPGEDATLALLAQTAAHLSQLEANVARDGLDWSMRRMPTAPRNGVLLSDVRRRT